MKRKALTATLLFVSCVLMGGCATQVTALPNEQAADTVYTDIKQDSTETLRKTLQNNKALEGAND